MTSVAKMIGCTNATDHDDKLQVACSSSTPTPTWSSTTSTRSSASDPRREPATTYTLSDVPVKDLIIVTLILLLWLYSIWLIVRAWAKIHNLGDPGQYLGGNMWRLVVEYLQRKKRGTINEMMRIHRLSLTLHQSRKDSQIRRDDEDVRQEAADGPEDVGPHHQDMGGVEVNTHASTVDNFNLCSTCHGQVSPSVIVSVEPDSDVVNDSRLSMRDEEESELSTEFVTRLASDSIVVHVNNEQQERDMDDHENISDTKEEKEANELNQQNKKGDNGNQELLL